MTSRGNKFIIFEGPDGVGKTTYQKMLLSYFRRYYPDILFTSDDQIKKSRLSHILTPIRTEKDIISEIALQHANISIQIDNLYRFILPAFQKNHSVIFDRSWMSTYVYSIKKGISKKEAEIIVRPIKEIWDFYKEIIPEPVFVVFYRDETLKPSELSGNDFSEILDLYKITAKTDIFNGYKICFIENNDLESGWNNLSLEIGIKYRPINSFMVKYE